MAGFISTAIAGPGPQYWQRQEKAREENAAKVKAAALAAKSAESATMACASCRTRVVEEFSGTNVSGKYAPHYSVVGRKHYCDACGGAITTVRGKTTDEMKANCPICAKAKAAKAACCTPPN